MHQEASSLRDTPASVTSSSGPRKRHPRSSLRVRNVAEGVVYHLVFEGDVQRLSGQQLRHHLARISQIPVTEQQLFVHGNTFTPQLLGAAVGLRQEDTVDLVRDSSAGSREGKTALREPSAATQSSLRPSTDAGTQSPESPYETLAPRRTAHGNEGNGNGVYRSSRTSAAVQPQFPPSQEPPQLSLPQTSASSQYRQRPAGASSVGSTATTSTRIAPSPERLVEPQPPYTSARHAPATYAAPEAAEYQRQTRGAPAPGSMGPPLNSSLRFDESQLPHWTSATTLSSLPTNYRDGEGGSPRPHVPSTFADPTAAVSGRRGEMYANFAERPFPSSVSYAKAPSSQVSQGRQQQPPYDRAAPQSRESSTFAGDVYGYHRPSYEVPSPYERARPAPSSPPRREPQRYPTSPSRPYGPDGQRRAAGLNQSQHESMRGRGGGGGNSNSSSSAPPAGRPRAFSPSSPPPPPSSSFPTPAPPHAYAQASVDPARMAAAAATSTPTRYIPVSADDLETLLEEQNYIWQMEDYRFRTERLNRLTALQNRQRALSFEAARYDQAVAEISQQLSREQQKLAELQGAMQHNTASLRHANGRGREEGVAAREREDAAATLGYGYAEDDVASEVVEVDV